MVEPWYGAGIDDSARGLIPISDPACTLPGRLHNITQDPLHLFAHIRYASHCLFTRRSGRKHLF